jgi:hypothetical protein
MVARGGKIGFRYGANTTLRESAMWWTDNSTKEAPRAKVAFRDAGRTIRGRHNVMVDHCLHWKRAWRAMLQK